MDSFERRGEATHSVAIVHTTASEAGEKIIPELSAGIQYIIFAILNYDDTTGSPNESKSKEQQGEIAAALNKLIEDIEPPIKLAVILLNDCTVEVISAKAGKLVPLGEVIRQRISSSSKLREIT